MPWSAKKLPENPELFAAVEAAMLDAQAYANSHGGEIKLIGVDQEGTVTVKFKGTCRFCPLATVTLKLVVEARLKELVPGVRKVVSG